MLRECGWDTPVPQHPQADIKLPGVYRRRNRISDCIQNKSKGNTKQGPCFVFFQKANPISDQTRSCGFHPSKFDSSQSLSNTEQWTVQGATNRGQRGEEPAVVGRRTAEPFTSGALKNWAHRRKAN
ncbi:hypothetical protein Q8A73_011057 [Channa argus]|nr:hypothetical protein Q8A73_011057 [Channa argus]